MAQPRLADAPSPCLSCPVRSAALCAGCSAGEIEARLRSAPMPVIARIAEDRVILDLRTVLPHQAEDLVAAATDACLPGPG